MSGRRRSEDSSGVDHAAASVTDSEVCKVDPQIPVGCIFKVTAFCATGTCVMLRARVKGAKGCPDRAEKVKVSDSYL